MTAAERTVPTAGELEARAAAAEAERAEATAALGEAALDGGSASAARRRVKAADEAAEAARLALVALRGREAEAGAAEEARRASARRLDGYEYARDLAGAAEAMLVAQAACREAEDAVTAFHADPRAAGWWRGSTRRGVDATSLPIDGDVVAGTPGVPRLRRGAARHGVALGRGFTVERLRAVRELAARRADEERRGEGRDFSGVEPTAERERRALRERRRAEWRADAGRRDAEALRARRERRRDDGRAGDAQPGDARLGDAA